MKRFSETTLWRDPRFRKLSPKAKHLHRYLWDHCDCAGVVSVDLECVSFHVGETIQEKHLAELKGWLNDMPGGRHVISEFVHFQCGELSATCAAHRPVFKAIKDHGLVRSGILYYHQFDSLSDRLSDTDKEPEKEKEPEKKEGVQGEIDAFPEVLNVTEFKSAWNRWHEHLKQKRKPATIHARDLQLATLSKLGVQKAVSAINHSIEHNWQGIYEPTNVRNGSTAIKPNPRNIGIIRGPTDYATAKTKFDREREAEEVRMAEQVAAPSTDSPTA